MNLKNNNIDQKILKILSNNVNLKILTEIRNSPMHTRELAKKLKIKENHVSSRIRTFLKYGIVKEVGWRRVGNKNVKLYELAVDSWEIELMPFGFQLKFKKGESRHNIPMLNYSLSDFSPPKTNFDFVGRIKELRTLNSSKRLVIVWGSPGIGKTSLVSKYLYNLKDLYKVFWYNFRETDTVEYLITKISIFLYLLGVNYFLNLAKNNNIDLSTKIDYIVKKINEFNVILIFDDFHLCQDKRIIEFINELYYKTDLKIIIISRQKPTNIMSLENLTEIRLEGFNINEIELFIKNRLKSIRIDYNKLLISMRKSISLYEYPLLLEIICDNIKKNKNIDLKVISDAKDYIKNLLFSSLNDDEQFILKNISIIRKPFTYELASFLITKRGSFNVYKVIDNLVKKGYIKKVGYKFILHEFIRLIAYENLEDKKLIHSLASSFYEKYSEYDDYIEALYHACLSEDENKIINVIRNYLPAIIDEGLSNSFNSIIENFLDRINNKHVLAWLLFAKAQIIANSTFEFDQFEKYINESLRLSLSLNDKELQLRIYLSFAQSYIDVDELEKAEHYLKVCTDTFKVNELDKHLAANLYQSTAELYFRRGFFNLSINSYHKAIKYQERVGNLRNLLLGKIRLAYVYFVIDEYEKSLDILKEIRKAVFKFNNTTIILAYNMMMALALHKVGLIEKAERYYHKWYNYARKLNYKIYECEALYYSCIFKIEINKINEAINDILLLQDRYGNYLTQYQMDYLEGIMDFYSKKYEEAIYHFRRSKQFAKKDIYFYILSCQMLILANFLLNPEESRNSIYRLINNFSKLGLSRKVESLKSLLKPNQSFIKLTVI